MVRHFLLYWKEMLLEKITDKVRNLISLFTAKTGGLADQILTLIPEGKRRLFLIVSGGALGVLIILVLILFTVNAGKRRQDRARSETLIAIPAEDFFLPEEPDYLPGLLFEREPEAPWTAGDAGRFWKDPGSEGGDYWREEMSRVIDKK
jgi:hypothetical protein